MTTVVQELTSDAYTVQSSPTFVSGAARYLKLQGFGTGATRHGFVYFNRPFPLGVTVLPFKLRFYQKGAAAGGSRVLTAQRAASKWSESTINYDNEPGVTGSTSASAAQGNGGTDGREWEIDITAQMQEVADGAPWYGLRVLSNNTTLLTFFSSESDVFQPQVEGSWSDAPNVPTVLSPSNGRAVSIARPTLSMDFNDVSGNTTLQYVHIQMNQGAPDDISPDVDTGNVPAEVPQWPLNFDVHAGEIWYWRGEVVDGAGIPSGFSDWVSFTRTAKPTVVIDNPAGSVSEPTPPVLWTVTGGTQTAYQLFVTDPDDRSEVLWTSGKVTSAADAANIPDLPTPLLTPGGEYGLLLRVWDDVARESTPGDPIPTDVFTTFTFDLTTDVDPVTGVTVTVSDGSPDPVVGWSDASAADSYTIIIDGVAVLSNLAAADAFVSGTSYSYPVVGVAPRVDHTLSVLRVVNGETSDDNPEESFITSPKGVWISTPDGLHKVSLANPPDADGSPITFAASELSAVRKPLGATNPVLITQAVFGPDGTCKAMLTPFGSESLVDVLATWETMTNGVAYSRGAPLSVVTSNKSFKAVLYNIVDSEQDEFGNWSPVEFDFFVVR